MPNSRSAIAPKLYERAFDLIAKDISSGALPSGYRLTEVALASRFGISRAPIRQALLLLAEQGLVQRSGANGYEVFRPGLDAVVADPTIDAMANDAALRTASRVSWQVIYQEIESAIVARTAISSWHVNEVALARHYDVSRTIARDVLARLQQRGILTKDERGRWFAAKLSDERVRDLFELRMLLEPVALVHAARHVPRPVLLELRDNVARLIGVQKGDDYPVILDQLEQDLHITLLDFCGNKALLEALSLPQTILITQHFLFNWTNDMFESEPFLPEHLAIFDHLLAGNVDAAAGALSAHLHISNERSLRRLRDVESRIELPEVSYLTRQAVTL